MIILTQVILLLLENPLLDLLLGMKTAGSSIDQVRSECHKVYAVCLIIKFFDLW